MDGIESEQTGACPGAQIVAHCQAPQPGARAVAHRRQRQQRMVWAWSTSLLSKIVTIGVQLLAVPLVYRALGEGGYAAYAAVTASAGLMGVLNLGIGGSLVTPIAEAAARSDEREQAMLVQAGLGPLVLLCLFGSIAVIPVVAFVPLSTLFGRVGATGAMDLRLAALIAVSATLAAIPLSSVSFLRQAYQEIHVSNLIGAGFNFLLLVALLVAVKRSSALAVFVAIFVLVPLGANILNFGLLFVQRRFLLRRETRSKWEIARHLMADGIRFLSASLSNVLVYQWPVYWIARTLPASTSSTFAICMQAAVLPIAFVLGLLQPLWSSTADALARADHDWLNRQIKRGRAVILTVGGGAFFTMLIFGERLVHLWLRKPIALDWQVRGLIGAYILLAIWEHFHFITALGLGRLREATMAVFQRAVGFAIAAPLLTMVGGAKAIWCGMCCSILFWTAWRLPRLLPAHVIRLGNG
jgi:O-antigen/teichoic acid export membrane protein